MIETTKYPINAETGLPALPEGYRWSIEKNGEFFDIRIQKEQDTERKYFLREKPFWKRLFSANSHVSYYETVTLVGEDRWKHVMVQPILILSPSKATLEDDYDDGFYVSDMAKVLTPEVILASAKTLVALLDEKLQAKVSEKYVGAYPPGKLNSE